MGGGGGGYSPCRGRDYICFLSCVFCSGDKQTVEDNCILANSIFKMLEIPFHRLEIQTFFGEHPPPEKGFCLYETSPLAVGTVIVEIPGIKNLTCKFMSVEVFKQTNSYKIQS